MMTIPEAFNIAVQHHQAGRLQEAEALYQQILQVEPNHSDALHLLGVSAHQAGRHEVAVAYIGRAIGLNPKIAEYHLNLGEAYRAQGRLDEAVASYRQALALKPDFVEAFNNLGNALKDQGKPEEAVAAYRQALALKPAYAEAYNNLGNALKDQGKLEEAVAAYRQALALKPALAEAYTNLGLVLQEQGKLEEAVACCRQALTLKQDFAEGYNILGNTLKDQGKLNEAIECYSAALRLKPDYADARLNKSIVLLLSGNFVEGWKEYEWRWEATAGKPQKRDFPQPRWDGTDIPGRTILLHAEQGLGDALQFIRYAPLVAKRGALVIVECQPALKSLFKSVEGVARIVARGDRLPDFDVHAPLLSLPLIWGTTLETIPAQVPYLSSDPELADAWRIRLERDGEKFKIGLVWAGRPAHKNDRGRNRSCSLDMFAPLAKVPGVTFYSLQKGEAAKQTADPPRGMPLIDVAASLNDFADTAALLSNLDLVISIDTAVAHLAGAMGKPAWTLLPFAPDWRWLLEREDSPWYPTMRLFRQGRPGDWSRVFARVAETLGRFVKERKT